MTIRTPVDGPRIVPFGVARTAADLLPNGRPAFRVTQRFDHEDAWWRSQNRNAPANSGPRHGAMDIGNHNCGDRVLAGGAGQAWAGTDQHGGRYVIIDHGGGRVTRYWHLATWAIPTGRWVAVARGQLIGTIGATGLGAACHLHLEDVFSGVKRDPWLRLEQNVPEDTMARYGGAEVRTETGTWLAKRNVRFRATPELAGAIYTILGEGTVVPSACKVRRSGDTGLWWREARLYVGTTPAGQAINRWVIGYAREDTLDPRPDPRPAILDRAATALEGVIRALEAATAAARKALQDIKEQR